MIHNLIIIGSGGLVFFHKAWYEDCIVPIKINTLAGAVTSIQEFAKHVVGYLATYVDFGELSLTLTRDHPSQLLCALFHDSEDGQEFGKLMASQLLHSFLDEYDTVDFSRSVQDTSKFATFTTKLHDAIRNSVVPVLSHLTSKKGHIQAIVVYADGKTHANAGAAGQEIGMAANIQPLLTTSSSLLSEKQQSLYLETVNRVFVIFRLTNGASLVCVCKRMFGEKEAVRADYISNCFEAVVLLEKVFQIAHNLHT